VTDIRIVTSGPEAAKTEVATEEDSQIREIVPPPAQQIAVPTIPAVSLVMNASDVATASSEPAPIPHSAGRTEIRIEVSDKIEPPVAAPPPKPAELYEPPRAILETKPARPSESPAKSPARDLAYGNPAKAIVDEAIWNLATGSYQAYKTALEQGKSATQAAETAGGQFAFVHRKISDYSAKLENLLAESKATIGVSESIDKLLEQAVSDVIGNGAMSDSEKDAAVQQLGTLQEWVKQGVQGSLLSPARAQKILLAIGERLNWGGPSAVPEEFKPVYRTLFGNMKTAIRAAVPDAQNLQDRLINLYAAKSDLESR